MISSAVLLAFLALLTARSEPVLTPNETIFLRWSPPSAFDSWAAIAGLVTGGLAGAYVAWRGERPWWTWLPGLGTAVLVLIAAAVPATRSMISLERDRVIAREGWPGSEGGVYPLDDVGRIEIVCGVIQQTKRSSVPTVDYVLVMSDGRRISTLEGVPGRSAHAVGRWIRVVEAWDRLPALADTPRATSASPECARVMTESLSPAAAAAGRRLLEPRPKG